MSKLNKLLGFLNRSFSVDPEQFLAFRLQYSGSMQWNISESILTTTVVGGPGLPLSVDLTGYTVMSLVNYLAAQPGYSVSNMTTSSSMSALVLMDGGADQSASNGDHLYGHLSLLFAFMNGFAVELNSAEIAVKGMLAEMATTTADGEWLDLWGSYLNVQRLTGEADSDYGPRIIVEVIRPRENNVAIAMAIQEAFGEPAQVIDVRLWVSAAQYYNSVFTHNSSHTYGSPIAPLYGLFDVQYGYNLESGLDMVTFASAVSAFVQRFRAAGTQMRTLSLVSGSTMTDSVAAPSDALGVTVLQTYYHDSFYSYGGGISYTGGISTVESF